MRKHAGVVIGAAIAAVGLLLAALALAGFSIGLPAVRPASALGASWFMIAVVLTFGGAVAALAARGLELSHEEHHAQVARARGRGARPVRQLRPERGERHLHAVR
jgi:hypothetical protein